MPVQGQAYFAQIFRLTKQSLTFVLYIGDHLTNRTSFRGCKPLGRDGLRAGAGEALFPQEALKVTRGFKIGAR